MSAPKCGECQKLEQKCRTDVQAVFEYEEVVYLTVTAAHSIRNVSQVLSKMPEQDLRRLTIQRDLETAARSVGKLLRGFDEVARRALVLQLRKAGLKLDIEVEACQHAQLVSS